MKRNLPGLFLIFSLTLFSCTKDRVTNPDTLNATQSIIYNENFDETNFLSPGLPTGWSAAPVGGWITDSSNFSTGYPSASGGRNLDLDNSKLPTGDYTLYSKQIATTGFKNITVTYGARFSKHFADSGSVIKSFAWSSDGGVNWQTIPFIENTNDSFWYIINQGLNLSLPATADNQPQIMFRWVAHVVAAASGSYRIDDFSIQGDSQ